MSDEAIRFSASVSQVRTMADGGIRIVLDLPETAIDTATKMMQAKQAGAILEVAAVAIVQDKKIGEPKQNDRPSKRFSPYAKVKAETDAVC